MKIVSHYLNNIEGVAIYPIISLTIFITIFVLISIWAMRIRKPEVQKMSNLPFDENEIQNQNIKLQN